MTTIKSHQRLAEFTQVRTSFALPSCRISSTLLCTLIVLALPLIFVACGKRRPPQPPSERVPQRTENVTGIQRGNQVILTWPSPQRNASDSSVQSIRRVDVYRLAEEVTAPLPLTEEEFASRSTLIGSVDYAVIRLATGTLSYMDTLELAGEPARLRYAVRYVNASGQRASFSNFLLIEPAARVATAPLAVVANVSESAIGIKWQAPAANIDGSAPVNVLGYNVYRIGSGESIANPLLLNSGLVSELTFADKKFSFGERYSFYVRAVSLGTGGNQVESSDSNLVTVEPRDVYPPSAPMSITIAAAPGRLSLFFPANAERDVEGYNLYRSLDPDLPKAQWKKLNGDLLTRTTFQDDNVETGKKYFYFLNAVDSSGNTSEPSEVVSETVP